MIEDPRSVRDDMLSIAEQTTSVAVSASVDASRVLDMLVQAWRLLRPDVEIDDGDRPARVHHVLVSKDFTRHDAVEYVVFVVNGAVGRAAGGVVLRFPDEMPDSFVAVDLRASLEPVGIDDVRAAFFEDARRPRAR